MEPGIINQLNEVPTYSYEKLTIEMVEAAILKVQEESEKLQEPKFVCTVFGTVEQVTKRMNEFNQAMINALNEMTNEKEINKRR